MTTTLKPHLIRADTLDLQEPTSPSAKDHSRQPAHPAPLGVGHAASHQNQTLRRAEEEANSEQHPGLRNGVHGRGQYGHEPDFFDDNDNDDPAQDGNPEGILSDEGEYGDQDAEDDLDDDMMDKISSSPSIDDGRDPLPVWPQRRDSLDASSLLSTPPHRNEEASSSSPFTSSPEHFPLLLHKLEAQSEPVNHHQGGYEQYEKEPTTSPSLTRTVDPSRERNALPSEQPQISTMAVGGGNNDMLIGHKENWNEKTASKTDLDLEDIQRFLLPVDDPLLDNAFDDAFIYPKDEYPDHGSDGSWEDVDESESEEDSESDDDTQDFQFTDDSRFLDSGWGGECLRDTEDIDFEFVYALHTFVATVEGQANATKGDTMVLLDDSNSYWWLVRVVKDGSIGYLPAEHIETPTERLARLNKHRNIDLSATMLGDNPEKSKNPLKKAMRRRNAKTVQFAAPQYFEPAEVEYSDDEEEESEGEEEPVEDKKDSESSEVQSESQTDPAAVKPLRLKSQQKPASANGAQTTDAQDQGINGFSDDTDRARTSEEMFEKKGEYYEDPPNLDGDKLSEESRSRNGTVRNTDSFFKDDTAETKKISLTPRLLRGNSETETQNDIQDASLKSRSSFDTLEKVSSEAERSREEKKKKDKKQGEKKSGMLSGLFKRKDKKGRQDLETDEIEKISTEESSRMSPQPKDSSDSLALEKAMSKSDRSPQRQGSKLQKAPPSGISPKVSPTKDAQQTTSPPLSADDTKSTAPTNASSTLRQVTSESSLSQPAPLNIRPSETSRDRIASPTSDKPSMYGPPLRPTRPESPVQRNADPPVKTTMQQPAQNPFSTDESETSADEDTPRPGEAKDRLSESPVEVSPIEKAVTNQALHHKSPRLMVDTSSSEPQSQSPTRSSSSGSLVEAGAPRENDRSTDPTTSPHADATTPSTARSISSWSDASLRQYMDNDEDIRDLLIIVHDKSNVIPAGPDHPITGNLFSAEKGRLAEMQTNLDNMLTGWLARKNRNVIPA